MALHDLYVIDKQSGRIHRIGDEQHDSIWIDSDKTIHYHNMQNGDGGTTKGGKEYGYCILESEDGMLEDEYGIIDKRFKKEIRAYLDGKDWNIVNSLDTKIDAMVVTRCKDCKHWQDAEEGIIEMPICKLHGINCKLGEENDFCSYGEVKNERTNL